jgi:LysM repeat protein
MESLRQVGSGFLLGLLAIAIILGAFSLAMAEEGLVSAALPTETVTVPPTAFPTLPELSTNLPPTELPQSPTPTITFTPPPPPTNCPPPANWIPMVVQPYDTLDSLAQTYRVTVAVLQNANCLLSKDINAGSILYVPPQPTSTAIPCGAPAGWVNYIVQSGDTLYAISLRYRVSLQQLQTANCLFTSGIRTGQVLKVPNWATSTPWFISPTPTLSEVPSLVPTDTASPTPNLPPATTETASPTLPPTEITLPSETPHPSATNTPETPPAEPPTLTPSAP